METGVVLFSAANNIQMLLLLAGAFVAGFASASVIRMLVPDEEEPKEFFLEWAKKLCLVVAAVAVCLGVIIVEPLAAPAIERFGFPSFFLIVLSLAATIFMIVWGLLCGTENRMVPMKELFSMRYFFGSE